MIIGWALMIEGFRANTGGIPEDSAFSTAGVIDKGMLLGNYPHIELLKEKACKNGHRLLLGGNNFLLPPANSADLEERITGAHKSLLPFHMEKILL